jgi:hypothetical protein
MKTVLCLMGVAVLGVGSVFAQADVIIKKRALELRDQNNVRQGVAPPTQPGQPAPPVASTPPTAALQQSLAKVRADLAAIGANAPVTAEQKLQFTKDLMASAQGPSKPSQSTLAPLAASLLAAFTQAPLPEKDRDRLVSRLAAVLNPARIQPAQMQAIYADIQAIFQANGMARKEAVKIVDQVKAVAAETQRSAG